MTSSLERVALRKEYDRAKLLLKEKSSSLSFTPNYIKDCEEVIRSFENKEPINKRHIYPVNSVYNFLYKRS